MLREGRLSTVATSSRFLLLLLLCCHVTAQPLRDYLTGQVVHTVHIHFNLG
jgi:hypothetical protein